MRAIVASSDLELTASLVSRIAVEFSDIPADEPVAIRTSSSAVIASHVEWLAWTVANNLGRPVETFSPKGSGRAATFDRDYDLVAACTSVVAFFSPEREMDGGTGHVVKAALDRGIAVSAYSVHPDGEIVYIGSDPGAQPEGPNDVLLRMWRENHQ